VSIVARREEANEHRIMIGSPVGCARLEHDAWGDQRRAVRLLFEGGLASVFDLVVVIEQVYFVGVDVPGSDTGYLRRQRGAGECIVKVAELAAEEI
jgi:hypothetical protein